MAPQSSSALDALAGYFSIELFYQLDRMGLVAKLERPCSVAKLARAHGLDPNVLRIVLEFLVTTQFVSGEGRDTYFVNRAQLLETQFNARKFAGAYGPVMRGLPQALRPAGGARLVDQERLAEAFSLAVTQNNTALRQLIAASQSRGLLDLGCGTGSLLVELALDQPRFRGFGIDSNRYMCEAARRSARDHGVEMRVRVRLGDATHPLRMLDLRERRGIDAVHGRSFLNACFRGGESKAIQVLTRLRTALPGRVAWFVDYYGELGQLPSRPDRCRRLGVLQDVVQALSGQGVPPHTERQWRDIYRRAGCDLQQSHNFDGEIRWFIHVVRLGSRSSRAAIGLYGTVR